MKNLRIKTGDMVKVITGAHRGKSGKVLQTFPSLHRVVVEGVGTAKRHLKNRKGGDKGQVIEFFMPIHASNVQLLGEDGKTRRHGKRVSA